MRRYPYERLTGTYIPVEADIPKDGLHCLYLSYRQVNHTSSSCLKLQVVSFKIAARNRPQKEIKPTKKCKQKTIIHQK